jgi:6-hydroxynicotinate 3-monooxygenase
MARQGRIAVVGAGLGGLAAAGLLQRAGFSVKVFEQTDAFARIGAGILLSSNVTKVTRRLGLEQAIVATGIKPDAFVSRDWETGETLYEITLDAASEERFGGPYVNIHRGDLHALLTDAVHPETISFGHRLSGLEAHDDRVKLVFANGATYHADIVIGADGIKSRVRDMILGEEQPRFTERVALRAIYPAERLQGFGVRDCVKWWGPDRHIISYFMNGKRDELYVIGVVPADAWDTDAASLTVPPRDFQEAFGMFHPDLRRVVDAATDVTAWPIFDRERNDRWSEDRIVLIGDACHPVPPFMAQGGAMAIEDAAILSRCLEAFADHREAFRRYQATRIPRVGEVQRISWDNTWMHGPTDPEWLFCYDPSTAPITSVS